MEEHAHLERLPGSIAIPLTLVAQRGTAFHGGGQFGLLCQSLDSTGDSPYPCFSRSSPCSPFQAARIRVEDKRTITSCYHISHSRELTKHTIQKDALYVRQTLSAIISGANMSMILYLTACSRTDIPRSHNRDIILTPMTNFANECLKEPLQQQRSWKTHSRTSPSKSLTKRAVRIWGWKHSVNDLTWQLNGVPPLYWGCTAWSRFWGMPSTLMAISLFGRRSGIPRCRLPRDDVLHRKQLNSIIDRLGFVLAHQPTAAETRKWSPGRGYSRRPPVPGAALL
jgi:hypothetical protein